MRLCYADPPYLGCCGLYDHEHGTEGGCWDDVETHRHLIDMLVNQFPDGWALSASSVSLRALLPLGPEDALTAAERILRPALSDRQRANLDQREQAA